MRGEARVTAILLLSAPTRNGRDDRAPTPRSPAGRVRLREQPSPAAPQRPHGRQRRRPAGGGRAAHRRGAPLGTRPRRVDPSPAVGGAGGARRDETRRSGRVGSRRGSPAPRPPPVTSIGWRINHVAKTLAGRADHTDGTHTHTEAGDEPQGTAAGAVAGLAAAVAAWRETLLGADDAALDTVGYSTYPTAPTPRRGSSTSSGGGTKRSSTTALRSPSCRDLYIRPGVTRRSFWICATCAVEHAERVEVCAICADERQWVPAEGQRWTTLEELAAEGHRVEVVELEPDLFGITATRGPGSGRRPSSCAPPRGTCCGTRSATSTTRGWPRSASSAGSSRSSRATRTCTASRWSGAGRSAASRCSSPRRTRSGWRGPDPVIETWSGRVEVLPGVTLTQPGGHFPGSAVAHWAAGADGRGVLLGRRHDLRQPGPHVRRVHAQLPQPHPAVRRRRRARRRRRSSGSSSTGSTATSPASSTPTPAPSSAGPPTGTSAGCAGDFDHLT